mmetsp:Transcript_17331/g.27672  ORF Transcript_17331/g.27672 Transcript_17331/m.27672 type:complete len:358 (-) Transcript_17331:36-1109(-)
MSFMVKSQATMQLPYSFTNLHANKRDSFWTLKRLKEGIARKYKVLKTQIATGTSQCSHDGETSYVDCSCFLRKKLDTQNQRFGLHLFRFVNNSILFPLSGRCDLIDVFEKAPAWERLGIKLRGSASQSLEDSSILFRTTCNFPIDIVFVLHLRTSVVEYDTLTKCGAKIHQLLKNAVSTAISEAASLLSSVENDIFISEEEMREKRRTKWTNSIVESILQIAEDTDPVLECSFQESLSSAVGIHQSDLSCLKQQLAKNISNVFQDSCEKNTPHSSQYELADAAENLLLKLSDDIERGDASTIETSVEKHHNLHTEHPRIAASPQEFGKNDGPSMDDDDEKMMSDDECSFMNEMFSGS